MTNLNKEEDEKIKDKYKEIVGNPYSQVMIVDCIMGSILGDEELKKNYVEILSRCLMEIDKILRYEKILKDYLERPIPVSADSD